MKKLTLLFFSWMIIPLIQAQSLYNNAATLTITNGSTVYIKGDAQVQTGSTITNNGTLNITGNFINNATMAAYNAGSLIFEGTATQVVSGNATYYTNNMTINNAAGVTLNALLRANGIVTFTKGIVTGTDNTKPLTFTASATISGASNASHVNGFVVKEGTGNFIYPTGNGTRYQPVAINATANANGIRVKYNAANAGSGAFTGTTPLLYYNTLEHWELTPLTGATGSVTIYWDDYNNVGIGNTADLRVAHLSGGNWLNEGVASVSGTIASGNVTGNVISSWGPFSLGSVSASSTLPVSWLSITGSLNAQKQAMINWSVREQNIRNYNVEKSDDGRSFTNIAALNSKGGGDNNYEYLGRDILQNISYYRIKQTDLNGKFSYSSVVKLYPQQQTELIVYPTPFRENFTVISPARQTARIFTTNGRLIKIIQLKPGTNYVGTGTLQKGIYILAVENHVAQKIIKE
ncbi:MAG: T9SS type A sorting domain-containing protein [Chitinophagaceae bacterium]|nr:T9SS type A sorting domain-containing protein [Chitinophagaceae bacterium]